MTGPAAGEGVARRASQKPHGGKDGLGPCVGPGRVSHTTTRKTTSGMILNFGSLANGWWALPRTDGITCSEQRAVLRRRVSPGT